MSETKEKYLEFRKQLTSEIKLVAVSKTKPEEEILKLYDEGQRIFGENKVQELVRKAENLPDDIEWHMIGHLQSNKVKYIAPFVNLIHAVDSLKLLRTINKEAVRNNRKINCLIQVHIAQEETKFGLSEEELPFFLDELKKEEFGSVIISGLMGMATFTDNFIQVKEEFRNLKLIFEEIKEKHFKNNTHFKELSMGMSDDYLVALDEGSTIIRIGSLIFGIRNYTN
ncbi:MAG: YggS family pyridoxal phosphate-dependent enzyme [Bacteroidales bacterium]|nr:YggS family pyridoxal phosphate-dependent enzyme [Bacteroidales bacterium]